MNHELNMQIAKFMGWKNVGPLQGGNVPFGVRPDDYNKDHPASPMIDEVPDYSGSPDAAWQMEEEIERRGLQTHYVGELWTLLELDTVPFGTTYWPMIHATPEQRCRAALEAVREKR